MCHQPALPTIEEAILAMTQEEIRLRVMRASNNPVRSAYIADNRDCYNCGEKGHLSYNCPLPQFGGRGGGRLGRGGDRGGSRAGRGGDCGARGKGRVGQRGYAAFGRDELPHVTLTGEQALQCEKWQKSSAIESSQGPSTTANNYGNFANYAQVDEGTQGEGNWEDDWDWSKA